jgi:hypothetical protein
VAFKKGQAAGGAMGLITLAVALMVGLFVGGNIYSQFVGDTATSTFSANVESTLNDTFDNFTTGMTLMGVAVIVMAAMMILGVMGGR